MKIENFSWWMAESLLTLGYAKYLVPAQGHPARRTVTPEVRSPIQIHFPSEWDAGKGKKQN
ncbi:hypothetical protein GB937_004502 [Aspergillus fischeri]|nr:hypothetical protein GB937_004502 [Aspergillus fischeri]